ncbi:hypothetical protein [Thalassobacillus pellis]|uniref:hypothetical protein n=1 Tax=Thalassobacillus pellis TaxID=748008 RepID=UPI00195F37A2|nr:hypothetical protein [Thalassobacillus pellis]MBM7552998.1 hypothetical protein [Thalassobacillus pellis]
MRELTSYHIQLNQSLTTSEIIAINKFVSKNDYEVYLNQDHLIADSSNLPKLLSFFLLADTTKPMKMIIDGENVEYAYQKLEHIWNKRVEQSAQRIKYTASHEDNISIVV